MSWNLLGKLIEKHVSVVGDNLTNALASFDPETALQVDRDNLQKKVIDVAAKLSSAKLAYETEHKTVVALQTQLSNDKNVLVELQKRLSAGTVTESTVNTFLDDYQANQNKLTTELEQEKDAQDYVKQLQEIIDTISKQLQQFDDNAKVAQHALEQAKAKNELVDLKLQRQKELDGLSGLKASSTALNTLTNKASTLNATASGKETLLNVLDEHDAKEHEIDAIRASVNTIATPSAADRLAALIK